MLIDDRRAHQRHRVHWRAQVDRAGTLLRGNLCDVSVEGALLACDQLFRENETLVITIALAPDMPGKPPVMLVFQASVAYSIYSAPSFSTGLRIRHFSSGREVFMKHCGAG